ncbi:hypothetical protein Tco_0905305, partial [Tanacetum coccineum]
RKMEMKPCHRPLLMTWRSWKLTDKGDRDGDGDDDWFLTV